MFSKLSCIRHLPFSRLILGGLALILLSACSQAIQPWVQPERSQELKQLKIDNYMLKQELAVYRKKLMQANQESRKLAGQLQRSGRRPANHPAPAVQNQPQGNRLPQKSAMSSAMSPSKPTPSPAQPIVRPVREAPALVSAAKIKPAQPKPAQLKQAEALVAPVHATPSKVVAAKPAATEKKQPPQTWTMKMRLFFGSGHKGTSPAMRRQLAAFVKTLPSDVKVRVAGHSDNEPVSSVKNEGNTSSSAPDNKAVSKERATAVVRALINAGLSSKRIQVGAFGAGRPLASNDSAEGRAKNRRVEIFINETAHSDGSTKQVTLAPSVNAVKQPPSVVKTVSPPKPAVKPTGNVQNTAPSIVKPLRQKTRAAQEIPQQAATDENWTMKMRLFFDMGQRWSSPAMRRQLRAFANTLPPTANVRIVGHSDNLRIQQPKASLEDNKAMSIERAKSVFRGLKAYGVKSERMQVEGFGATQPLVSNGTAEGRAKNRRVEILISE